MNVNLTTYFFHESKIRTRQQMGETFYLKNLACKQKKQSTQYKKQYVNAVIRKKDFWEILNVFYYLCYV